MKKGQTFQQAAVKQQDIPIQKKLKIKPLPVSQLIQKLKVDHGLNYKM